MWVLETGHVIKQRIIYLASTLFDLLLPSGIDIDICGQNRQNTLITSPAGAVPKYCDEYVCLWVCLSARLRGYLWNHIFNLYQYCLCMLPMSVAQSSSDMFTIGRITYRREGVFFPIENALSARKGGWECTARAKCAIYDCLVCSVLGCNYRYLCKTCKLFQFLTNKKAK